MSRLEEIDLEIKELQERLPNVKGRETEVYSRIVGYFRSVNSWNDGKRSEYGERRTFDLKSQSVTSKLDTNGGNE